MSTCTKGMLTIAAAWGKIPTTLLGNPLRCIAPRGAAPGDPSGEF